MLIVAATLFLFSKIIDRKTLLLKNKSRVQGDDIKYSDLNRPGVTFFSKKHGLSGRPDYIIKKNKHLIPVEVKTSSYNNFQKGHVLQLAAYCQLIEDTFNIFVPYGILVYANKERKIFFEPGLRFELEKTLEKMRNTLLEKNIVRNHNDKKRCLNCSMKNFCNKKIMPLDKNPV